MSTPIEPPQDDDQDEFLSQLSSAYSRLPMPPLSQGYQKKFHNAVRLELIKRRPMILLAIARICIGETSRRVAKAFWDSLLSPSTRPLVASAAMVAVVTVVAFLIMHSPEELPRTIATAPESTVPAATAPQSRLPSLAGGADAPADTVSSSLEKPPLAAEDWVNILNRLAAANRKEELSRSFAQFKKFYPDHPLAKQDEWKKSR